MPPRREAIVPPDPTPRVIAAIVARLKARPNLESVFIAGAPQTDILERTETIQVSGAKAVPDWDASGRLRVIYNIEVFLGILVMRAGAGDELATEVRERAYALKHEIEIEIRASIEGIKLQDEEGVDTVRQCQFGPVELEQSWSDRARWAQLTFSLTAEATTTISYPEA